MIATKRKVLHVAQVTERLRGEGRVSTLNEDIAHVSYKLQVAEDESGWKKIYGHLVIIGDSSLIDKIAAITDVTTLHRKDGRQLDFSIPLLKTTNGDTLIEGVSDFR